MVRPGLAAARWFLSSVKASVREAAANTVIDPDTFGEGVGAADAGDVEPPQAASKKDRPTAPGANRVTVSNVASSYGELGSSTVTLVALTAATTETSGAT